jgi:hypothetical protein
MDKNFVRVDILIPVYESSLDKTLGMASIRPDMLVIDQIFFHILIAYPIIKGDETLSHVRATRIISGSL